MKGIAREVVPYAIDGGVGADGATVHVVTENTVGLDLYLDPGRIDSASSAHVRDALQRALAALDAHERGG
jgi:hypothetical protein